MFHIVYIVFFIIASFYLLLIASFSIGFLKLKNFKTTNDKKYRFEHKLSIIIPFKNEANNLKTLVNGLINQTLEDIYFEVIFINDHSTDRSEIILKELISDKNNFKILNLSNKLKGKKSALSFGINHASNNIIVTTDADCIHHENWLKNIFIYFSNYNPKMLIAPVLMKGIDFFGKLQSAEFFSLTASTAGACGINRPIMCNGANLAFKKEIFQEFKDALYEKEISGDDVFLLHNIKKKYPRKIKYLKSSEAAVITFPEKNIRKFYLQRIRWASKSKSYKDFDTVITSLIVFFANLSLIISGTIALFSGYYMPFILVLLLKFIPDIVLFSLSGIFFKQTKLLYYFLLLFPFYPFYILLISISAFFKKKVLWK